MLKKASRIRTLQYTHSAVCCGKTWRWVGAVPKRVQYICPCCTKEMVPVQQEVRTLEACELIYKYQDRFRDEPCPNCGQKVGHHVVECPVGTEGNWVSAFFLHCSRCGEELREILEEELS